MERVGETFIVKELCPLRRKESARHQRGVHSGQYHHNVSWGESDFGSTDPDPPLLKPLKMNKSLIYAKDPSPASQPQVSIPPVGPIRNSARSSLSHPIGRIVSQSQSWLSPPRTERAEHIRVHQTLSRRTNVITTMCNVNGRVEEDVGVEFNPALWYFI